MNAFNSSSVQISRAFKNPIKKSSPPFSAFPMQQSIHNVSNNGAMMKTRDYHPNWLTNTDILEDEMKKYMDYQNPDIYKNCEVIPFATKEYYLGYKNGNLIKIPNTNPLNKLPQNVLNEFYAERANEKDNEAVAINLDTHEVIKFKLNDRTDNIIYCFCQKELDIALTHCRDREVDFNTGEIVKSPFKHIPITGILTKKMFDASKAGFPARSNVDIEKHEDVYVPAGTAGKGDIDYHGIIPTTLTNFTVYYNYRSTGAFRTSPNGPADDQDYKGYEGKSYNVGGRFDRPDVKSYEDKCRIMGVTPTLKR